MMDIKGVLLQSFESFLRKKIQTEQLKMEIKIQLKNYTNKSLKNSRKEKVNSHFIENI